MTDFFPWLWRILDLPALMLVAVMGLLFYAVYRVQTNKQNDFDFSDMFRDDSGKPSAARMMVLVCGGVSSWAIMYMLMHSSDKKIDAMIFGIYLAVWSGSALAAKWMETNKSIAGMMQGEVKVGVTAQTTVTTTQQGVSDGKKSGS